MREEVRKRDMDKERQTDRQTDRQIDRQRVTPRPRLYSTALGGL